MATIFTWFVTAAGAALVFGAKKINAKVMDCMLGFADGAMIFVVVEELISESQQNHKHIDMVTMGGFKVMMILDVALG